MSCSLHSFFVSHFDSPAMQLTPAITAFVVAFSILIAPFPATAQASSSGANDQLGTSSFASTTALPSLSPQSPLEMSVSCEMSSPNLSLSNQEDASSSRPSDQSVQVGESGPGVISSSKPLAPYPGAVPAQYHPGTEPFRAIYAAAQTYRRSGYARVIPLDDGTEVYPYGKEIPVVKTPILHFTTLQLAPNEYAVNRSVGDQERWSVETGTMGTKGDFQQLIYVKPRGCGPMQTNLTIATNQHRTYEVTLKALPCNSEGDPVLDGWTRKVSWYYPDGTVPSQTEMMKQMNRPELASSTSAPRMGYPRPSMPSPPVPQPASASSSAPSASGSASSSSSGSSGSQSRDSRIAPPKFTSTSSVDTRDLNTNYWEVKLDRRFPCEPELVGDDGERTFIRLGNGPECQVTFPLYRINPDRSRELVNYEVFNGTNYRIEGVYAKMALLYMDESGRTHRAVLENKKLQRLQSARRGSRR